MTRAVALIDGEHYAPVVRDAFAELPYDFVAALLVGGSEKLRGAENIWRIRVADYRVLYQVLDDVLAVLIVRIGRRRDVYR